MPGGDATGPRGMGPMTGRRAGFCAGYAMPGSMNPISGRAFDLGFGGGWSRGWRLRNWYFATGLPGWARFGYGPVWGGGVQPLTKEQEANILKAQAQALQEQLDAVKKRIEEIEQEK